MSCNYGPIDAERHVVVPQWLDFSRYPAWFTINLLEEVPDGAVVDDIVNFLVIPPHTIGTKEQTIEHIDGIGDHIDPLSAGNILALHRYP